MHMQSEPGTLRKGKWHEVVSILQAWLQRARTHPEAPIHMEALLKRLVEERQIGNNPEVVLDAAIYQALIQAWARAALHQTTQAVEASQRARQILVTVQENYERTKDEAWKPDAKAFRLVLHTVCKTEPVQAARRLHAWMFYLNRTGKNTNAKPQRSDHVKILCAYASSPQPDAGVMAEKFLRNLRLTDGMLADTLCYNLVMKAYLNQKGREAAEHAHRILEQMEAPPDMVTYATAISAWAGSGMKAHAVSRVEEILRAMEAHGELEANTVVLNAVMSTWVRSKNAAAVHRTGEIIQQMELSSTAPPDLVSYNTHLHALSLLSSRNASYAIQADALLQKLEAGHRGLCPNTFSYNIVIEAYCRSPLAHAATRAAAVLQRMVKFPGVEPDTFSFNQVLAALGKSSRPGSGRVAEELYRYMLHSYETKVLPDAKPDSCTLSSVISALSRSGERGAAFRAERLLQRMEKVNQNMVVKPNRICYNALIDCWAKSGEGTLAARKAEAILHFMQEQYNLGNSELAPNLMTYNSVLNAWARSGTRCCGRKAELYLNQMWELYHAGNKKVKPNDFSYNTVINAISKSKDVSKAQKALRLLRRMDKLYQAGNKEARPNEVTYTAVLNSCAFPAVLDQQTRRKALNVAIFTFDELLASGYGQPNQITYATFFLACANLLSDKDDDARRREILKRAFWHCCQDGQLGDIVLAHFRRAAPMDLYQELLHGYVEAGTTIVRVENLPREWRCNLDKKRTRNQRMGSNLTSSRRRSGTNSRNPLS